MNNKFDSWNFKEPIYSQWTLRNYLQHIGNKSGSRNILASMLRPYSHKSTTLHNTPQYSTPLTISVMAPGSGNYCTGLCAIILMMRGVFQRHSEWSEIDINSFDKVSEYLSSRPDLLFISIYLFYAKFLTLSLWN